MHRRPPQREHRQSSVFSDQRSKPIYFATGKRFAMVVRMNKFARRSLILGGVSALAACVLMPKPSLAALPPTLKTFPIKFYGAKGDGRIGPTTASINSGTPNLTGGSGFTT